MSEMLREAIAKLDGRLQAKDRELQQAFTQNREEQEKIEGEIGSLQQRLDALVQQAHLLEEQRASLAAEHVHELVNALKNEMAHSASSIVRAANFLFKRLRLIEEQARMLDSEPELARQYDDYRKMEDTRDALPRSYLRFHEAVGRRISPFLRLKDQEASLRYDSQILLLIMIAIDKEEGMAHWVLPLPEESRLPEHGRELLRDQLMETMTNAVAAVANHEDWHLANVMPDLWWSGYPGLVASCKYGGEEIADESAEKILTEYFVTRSAFRNCDLQVNVVEIGMEIWRRGIPGREAARSVSSQESRAVANLAGDGQFSNEEGQSIAASDGTD
jgi:hypothetical protein